MRPNLPLVVAASLASSIVTLAVSERRPAYAEAAPDAVARLVPYQGTLEKNGTAVSGTVTLGFTLTSLETNGTSTVVWTETQSVDVHKGRFSVLLGSTSQASSDGLVTALTDADDLYLAVSLTTDSGTVKLGKSQRFHPATATLWATAASDFAVSGDLAAGFLSTTGAVDVSGAATLTDVSVGGNIVIGYQLVTCQQTGTCSCPSGTKLLGGGGECASSAKPDLNQSYPNSDSSWHAQCNGGNTSNTIYYIACARLSE